jgi:putative tryptophan/tyrosine transport system substrate-binding protein
VNRRTFLGGLTFGLLAAPLAALAQQAGKVWRIGYLGDGSPASRASINLDPFREGLRELGYIEGQNVVIEARWSDGKNERLASLAADLVRQKVDVIVTHGLPATRAAKNATTTIPIVVAVIADILGTGIVESLSRPGGNITGMTDQVLDLSEKEVELLKEMVPSLTRVGILWNRGSVTASKISELSRAAARKSGVQVTSLDVQNVDDLDTVVESAAKARLGAVIVVHDPLTVSNRVHVAQTLLRRKLPAICGSLWLADAGLLMAYGPNQTKMWRRAAVFVDKILKGAKPADLPVEQPTKFELVINLKTAKALGLSIPQSLLLRADQVIE